MGIPSCFREVGLTPESCGSRWSAQTDQKVDHGRKQGDTSSLVQSRQWNGDEIKEGRDSQCDLDVCHKESRLDHPLGHWSECRCGPRVQGRSEKETGGDISGDSLKNG